ncbi:uncharacterized protein V6R79_019847 [Siganus canaliculatus]
MREEEEDKKGGGRRGGKKKMRREEEDTELLSTETPRTRCVDSQQNEGNKQKSQKLKDKNVLFEKKTKKQRQESGLYLSASLETLLYNEGIRQWPCVIQHPADSCCVDGCCRPIKTTLLHANMAKLKNGLSLPPRSC